MPQSNLGKTCPYCQFPLKADSDVVECRIPHHRECWAENGGCTTFGCREKSCQTVAAAERLEITFDEASGRESAAARGGGVNKLLAAALVITLLAVTGVVFAYINLLSDRSAALTADAADVSSQTYDPVVIATLDADYYIDYENGTIPIGDLPIGARVVDPSWEWEYKLGVDYSDRDYEGDPMPPGEVKPVTWIVVAKDHYDGLEPLVTLLSEELIAQHTFDNSTGRGHEYDEYGYNHWGDSGTANATRGLRPWLNSTGIHSGEGFYQAFSESFKNALLTTTLPNKDWKISSSYSTSDSVFIPSSTELGDNEHEETYRIGDVYPYDQGTGNANWVAMIGGETWWYWTRSPATVYGYLVRYVNLAGGFTNTSTSADYTFYGVRPAINLNAGTLVSEIRN